MLHSQNETCLPMGCRSSKVSTVLECPSDGNPEDFRKICRLFDRLDADSNLGVCIEELRDVANLHVKNRIADLMRQKTLKAQQLDADILRLEAEEKSQIAGTKATFKRLVSEAREQNTLAAERLSLEIKRLENLNPAGKSSEFMRVLKPKDSAHIDFWCFYDYMKTRVRDMDNIEHTQ